MKWSNLANVVYKRTYARKDTGVLENWNDTVERVIAGNVRNQSVSEAEINRLRYFIGERKAMPAGRGLWFSGSPSHGRIGGVALCNCWALSGDDWMNFVIAQDLLMLGGGVGMSVEHRYVSKLPRIKKDVKVVHRSTKDAQFIVPDSREGWNELLRRTLEAFFVTGKSFTYSTVCVRGAGEAIHGFGGVSSGPLPLITLVEKLCGIFETRAGRALRPIDAMDVLCCIGEMVVSGNVRRSAIIILGDAFDKDYLRAKRWDLGPIPTQRAMANLSVVCDDVEDLHPMFWKTYEHGEPFGIVNRTNIQTFGRMGEKRKDTATLVNPCSEATLEDGEACVAGDTPIITKDGIKPIRSLVGKEVEIWNGAAWSKVTPRLTGTGRQLYRVHISDGSHLDVTSNHGFSVAAAHGHGFVRVQASDLMGYIKGPLRFEPTQIVKEGGLEVANAYELGQKELPHADMVSWSQSSLREYFAGLMDAKAISNIGKLRLFVNEHGRARLIQQMLTAAGVTSIIDPVSFSLFEVQVPGPHGAGTEGLPCRRQDIIERCRSGNKQEGQFLMRVEPLPGTHDTFCFDEPERHMGVFGNVLTFQCNLQELPLPNLANVEEFAEAARLMHRWGKRVSMERFHIEKADEVIRRNRRVGTGITGCLKSPLFVPETLDRVYAAIQDENIKYSKELGINESIRTTVIKPSGTASKLADMGGYEGIHAAYSRYFIQRIRFSATDPLVPLLRAAGHRVEPVIRFDGSLDHATVVVDFYEQALDGPVADENWDTWKQLETLKMAQRHWADQAVSVTVYYKKEELPQLKAWLAENLKDIKTISFLCHSDHGFKQAPKEAIDKETYERESSKISDINTDGIGDGSDLDNTECINGACPIK